MRPRATSYGPGTIFKRWEGNPCQGEKILQEKPIERSEDMATKPAKKAAAKKPAKKTAAKKTAAKKTAAKKPAAKKTAAKKK